jgi:excisionase family DNA binding protein
VTASATEFTALPPPDGEGFRELLRLVGSQGRRPARLVGPDGTATELPVEVFEVLRQVVEVMAAGKAVTVAPHNLLLTTQEAADLLGISRPTLVRLLERGDIAFTQPNRHRRVRLVDVLDYQQRAAQDRASALAAIVAASEDLGLYDDQDEPPLRR